MKKVVLINYRTFLYTAVNCIAGAFLCLLFCVDKIWGSILIAVLAAVNITLSIFFRHKIKYIVGFLISAVAILSMLISTVFITTNRFADVRYDAPHTVSGVVVAINSDRKETEIVLKDISIDGNRYKGKIKIYVETESQDKMEFLREGDTVDFTEKISVVDLLNGGLINTFSTANDVRYIAYLHSSAVAFTPGEVSVLNKFHHKLKMLLTDFMGLHYGNIAYSILSGNKNDLEISTIAYFSTSGLGHIMAVSGLHIGFLIALLSFFLKKVSPKIKIPIICAVTVLYMIFADFSTSVLRAVIMSTVGLLPLLNGQRSDILNNLSLAFTLILATSPFTLFNAGFLMSVSAVFGIACFANTFNRAMRKIKFPKFLASALSVSAAAQLGITPCLLYFFHSLPLYSILVNVLMMPVIMLAFMTLLLTSIFAMLFSIAIPLIIPQTLLIIVDAAAQFVSTLPLAQITIYVAGTIFLLLPMYFLLSRYLMVLKGKWAVNIGILLGCCAIFFSGICVFPMDNVLIPINGYNDVTTLVFRDNKVFLVGDCKNSRQIKKLLTEKYVTALDGIYLNTMDETVAETLISLQNFKNNGKIYCPYDRINGGLTTLVDNNVFVELFDPLQDLPGIQSRYSDTNFAGYGFSLQNGKTILFLGNDVNYAKLSEEILHQTAILRCKMYLGFLEDRIYITNLGRDTIGQTAEHHYSVFDDGQIIFDYQYGKIYT